MLIGAAVGLLLGVLATIRVDAVVRPDLAIGLVLGVPTVIGMTTILVSTRRWATGLGAFLVALAPGWFAAMVLIQVVHGG